LLWCPQGTVLGPILFLIYINDFADYIQHSTLRLFADDSIIYTEKLKVYMMLSFSHLTWRLLVDGSRIS